MGYYPDTTKRANNTVDAPLEEEVRSVHLTQSEKISGWNKMMLYMEEHPLPEEEMGIKVEKTPSKRSPLFVGLVAVSTLFVLGILSAAQNALPGSPMYPLKTQINETIRSGISTLTGTQEEWNKRRALRRLYEAENMAKQQKLDEKTANELLTKFRAAQSAFLASDKIPEIENYKAEVIDYYNRFQDNITEGGNLGLSVFVAGIKDAIGRIDGVLNNRSSAVSSTVKSVYNSSIEVGVSSPKKSFIPKETLQITVSARNTANTDQRFDFRTGCQAKYWIGEKEFGSEFCTQALTSFTLPPNTSRQWSFTAQAPQEPGNYTVMGEVIGYGTTSITIEVK